MPQTPEHLRDHISQMLPELAELAESGDDDVWSDLAFRLRLLTMHPALNPPRRPGVAH